MFLDTKHYLREWARLPSDAWWAKSLDKLIERIQEAIDLCLEVDRAAVEALEFVGVQKITVGQ